MWQAETSRNPISTLPTVLRLNFQCLEGEKKNSPPIGVVYSQLTSKSEVGNLTSDADDDDDDCGFDDDFDDCVCVYCMFIEDILKMVIVMIMKI